MAYGATPVFIDPVKANTLEYTYVFAGWTPAVVPVTGNATYQATFTQTSNKFGISYYLDGGENDANNGSFYYYGVGVPSFGDAHKYGYSFEGWYSDSSFTNRITSIPATSIGHVDLYAKFKPCSYSIFYRLNGGINAKDNPVSYTYGEGVSSFAPATKEGHDFEGWYEDSEFTKPIKSIYSGSVGDRKLYAKFVARTVIAPKTEDTNVMTWQIVIALLSGLSLVFGRRRKKK